MQTMRTMRDRIRDILLGGSLLLVLMCAFTVQASAASVLRPDNTVVPVTYRVPAESNRATVAPDGTQRATRLYRPRAKFVAPDGYYSVSPRTERNQGEIPQRDRPCDNGTRES